MLSVVLELTRANPDPWVRKAATFTEQNRFLSLTNAGVQGSVRVNTHDFDVLHPRAIGNDSDFLTLISANSQDHSDLMERRPYKELRNHGGNIHEQTYPENGPANIMYFADPFGCKSVRPWHDTGNDQAFKLHKGSVVALFPTNSVQNRETLIQAARTYGENTLVAMQERNWDSAYRTISEPFSLTSIADRLVESITTLPVGHIRTAIDSIQHNASDRAIIGTVHNGLSGLKSQLERELPHALNDMQQCLNAYGQATGSCSDHESLKDTWRTTDDSLKKYVNALGRIERDSSNIPKAFHKARITHHATLARLSIAAENRFMRKIAANHQMTASIRPMALN